jgi:hypothetical protein
MPPPAEHKGNFVARYVVEMPMRFTAFVSALLGLVLATGSPVSGDCVSPTIEIGQHEVVRGGQLVVSGYAFGETCYDTFSPPEGQGELGRPIADIEIYIVQRADEFLVATGAANSFYKFTITVVIPPDLVPGVAEIEARWTDRVAFSEDPQIVVTDAAPLLPTQNPVVTFVPRPSTITAPPPSTTVTTTTEAFDSQTGDDGQASQKSSPTAALLFGGAGALFCLVVAIKFARQKA